MVALETTFPMWAGQFCDIVDRLDPEQAGILLDVAYSSWLENSEPTRCELEVLARQIVGEITADDALAALSRQRS